MTDPSQAPATNDDLRLFMDHVGSFFDRSDSRYVELKDLIADSEERVKEHFDLAIEITRSDLVGANRDRIEVHEHRIARLEMRAGIRSR